MARRVLAASGLVLLLALPRVARLLYPQVWIEDDSYIHGAFLLTRGYLPYRDFPLPHFPLLEYAMAAIFRVAPVTIRTAELFTAAAAFASSLLVFSIGRRLDGPATGLLAAVVFATSDLLFRYHVFEREVFLIVPVLAAVRLLMPNRRTPAPASSAIAAGALLACAMAIKLTAVATLIATIGWLVADGGRRSAARVAATTAALLGAAACALAWRFGLDFLVQVFLFRVVHATFPSIGVKVDEVRYTLDVSLALGVAGLGLIAWRGDGRRWLGPLLQLATGVLVLIVLNPTFWAHTGIELLPWLALLSGHLLAATWRAVSGSARGRAAPLVCTMAAAALLASIVPLRNVNWQPGEDTAYGFGYRDRAELDAMGAFVRTHSAADATVATPPIIAFVANRAEVIPYPEVAGTIDELTTAVRRDGVWRAIARAAAEPLSFWDSVEASRDHMAPRLDAAITAHRVAVVIDDSPDDLLAVPLVNLTPDRLSQSGYGLEWASAHYEAWVAK
ncbi:MAG TPA: glycosyltransferase family 39 protein [Vicinamibacterales bacterium]|nr:glycosyltransferase family 39 protein [Vicinamibacterales bacterium]